MLTKTQSLGVKSPNKSGLVDSRALSRPSPSSRLARTQSLPSTPSKSPPRDLSPNPAALLVPLLRPMMPREARPNEPTARRGQYASRWKMERLGYIRSEESGPSRRRGQGELCRAAEDVRSGQHRGGRNVRKPLHGGSQNLHFADCQDLLAARAPQPVSDMRSKGENRRFMDEVAYLVDPVADNNTRASLRRSR